MAAGAFVTETIEAGQEHALASTSTSHAGGGNGGNHCGSTLEAKRIGNHCGGTTLLSPGRAWAAVEKCELGLDEIGLMVLAAVLPARMRPCRRKRRGQERRVERSVQVGCAARC